jgi:hypothetical protein
MVPVCFATCLFHSCASHCAAAAAAAAVIGIVDAHDAARVDIDELHSMLKAIPQGLTIQQLHEAHWEVRPHEQFRCCLKGACS